MRAGYLRSPKCPPTAQPLWPPKNPQDPGREGLCYSQGSLSQSFQCCFQSGHLKGCLGWLKAAGNKLQRGRQREGGRGFSSLVMHLYPTCEISTTSLHALSPPCSEESLGSQVLSSLLASFLAESFTRLVTVVNVKSNPLGWVHKALGQLASTSLYGLLAQLASPCPQLLPSPN